MEEVRKVIATIEDKVKNLKNTLAAVDSENETLKMKVNKLETRLEEREKEIVDFQEKIDNLSQRNESTNSDSLIDEEEQNAQIEALVREIDDCISQLKK